MRDPAEGLPAREIRFDGVSFRYPGADHDVLLDFHLTVPAGRSLAIVGANGAGKTTDLETRDMASRSTGWSIVHTDATA